jgi:hypothetical protein
MSKNKKALGETRAIQKYTINNSILEKKNHKKSKRDLIDQWNHLPEKIKSELNFDHKTIFSNYDTPKTIELIDATLESIISFNDSSKIYEISSKIPESNRKLILSPIEKITILLKGLEENHSERYSKPKLIDSATSLLKLVEYILNHLSPTASHTRARLKYVAGILQQLSQGDHNVK